MNGRKLIRSVNRWNQSTIKTGCKNSDVRIDLTLTFYTNYLLKHSALFNIRHLHFDSYSSKFSSFQQKTEHKHKSTLFSIMCKNTFFSHLFSHVLSVCYFLFIFQSDGLLYYVSYMSPFPSFFNLSYLENIHSGGSTRHPVMKVCTSFIIFNNPPVFVGVQSVEEIVTAVLVWSVRELKDKRKQCSKLCFPAEF